MIKLNFPENFVWGVGTASYQVEGAVKEDGRGESIWDRFSHTPSKTYQGDTGDIACDQYHRYREDIALMDELGIDSYRFSIAWPRIIPRGTGEVNKKGIEHYRKLILHLKSMGIEPNVTLYHWDLPQVLQDAGGWANRETAYAFLEYAKVCFDAFGDIVNQWASFNEPRCVAMLGYNEGIHAPGIKDEALAWRAVHHLNLAHGLASREFRQRKMKGAFGIVWNFEAVRPARQRVADIMATESFRDSENRMYMGPVLGKGYPEGFLHDFNISLPIEEGDMEVIASGVDFIGINYYTEGVASLEAGANVTERKMVRNWERQTVVGWPVVPRGLLRLLRWTAEEAPGIPLYVTENGCAECDSVVVNKKGQKLVHDSLRIAYLTEHLKACSQAIAEGIPLKGYYVWSFMDNFEWAHGYKVRFGIIYIDYQNLERICKDSFYFYRDVISGTFV